MQLSHGSVCLTCLFLDPSVLYYMSRKKQPIKIIKINLLWVIVGVIALTMGLNIVSKLLASGDTMTVTKTTKEVSLDEFLSGYHHLEFEKIVLKNGTDLQGFIPVSGDANSTFSLMSLQKKLDVKYYDVQTTTKPLDSSLGEMGIVLTGETIIQIENEKESFLTRLFVNTVLPMLVVVVIFILGMRLLGGKGGV